jgi:hypothetical protein
MCAVFLENAKYERFGSDDVRAAALCNGPSLRDTDAERTITLWPGEVSEVKITREGDYAFIEYKEEGIPTTRLQIGPEIAGMSDEEIVELHNECLRAQAKRAAEYKHVAVEVPLGSAQTEYRARSDQWVPRGCFALLDPRRRLPVSR